MFKRYTTGDGLQGKHYSALLYFNQETGELFAGGPNGFTSFYPEQIQDNPYLPPVVLTSFKIFNRDVKLDRSISHVKEITLNYDENVFSFEFAALNYINSKMNRYSYKMEGFDSDWTEAGVKRDVTYTNLDPGNYVFKVKGSNNDGVWNEEGSSVRITILPPWWETSWAYAAYILMFSASIFGVWRFQVNRLKIRHQLEMEHFEANNLREMDKVKSRFFANISHEFRTPLTLIQGPLKQLLSNDFQSQPKKLYRMMLRNSHRLLQLINQLLDLSKLESGRMVLQARSEDITRLLKGLVLSFTSLAERQRITLKFEAEEKAIIGYIDREKLEKIINNLLSNAFKFTPEGGVVSVTVSVSNNHNNDLSLPALSADRRGVSATKQSQDIDVKKVGLLLRQLADRNDVVSKGWFKITVSDTGPGIPPDRLNKIFDRFYQVDDSLTRNREGTGIGLALTKELVELHHGEITVSSEVRNGTSFSVRLPISKNQFKPEEIVEEPLEKDISSVVTMPLEDAEVESSKKETKPVKKSVPAVLIVEDNADVRSYIRSYLDEDYRNIEAKDGEDGLKKAINKMPDLIISDIMMPKMDGVELCKRIKTDERTSHIPVILLTAKADVESRIEGLETGADDYVTKPFDANVLQVRVKNLIEQRKALREKFGRDAVIEPKEITVTSTDEKFLHKAIDTIEENISNPRFNVEEFRKEMYMSRMQLFRKIHALTNRSPSAFIRTMRLRRATQLLDQNFGNITEVAYEVGFNNLSYFAKCFRELYGISPSHYQQSD